MNGCYVITTNQAGHFYSSQSMAVDPLGRTLAVLGDKDGLAIVDLDRSLVAEVRQKLPLLKNRRIDVCADQGLQLNYDGPALAFSSLSSISPRYAARELTDCSTVERKPRSSASSFASRAACSLSF